MKLVDKDILSERIKKLKMDIGNIFNEYDEGFWDGRTTAFDDVICTLNTIEVKDEDSFDATVCKIGSTYLKEIEKDVIAKVLEPYKNGDKVKVIIKAQKGE